MGSSTSTIEGFRGSSVVFLLSNLLSNILHSTSTLIASYLLKNYTVNEHPLKNHPLKLIIDTLHEDDDPWDIEWMMFNVLNDFLQPDTKLSVDEAARCLDAIVPDNRPNEPGQEKEPALNWMLEMSDLIWKVAKQMPCDHESQDKLVQLLGALRRLPITATCNHGGPELPIWRESFDGWCDSERHSLVTPEKRNNPPKTECEQYINANAFLARVRAAGVMKCCDYLYGYSAVQDAVKDTIDETSKGDVLPCHIVSGAQWVVQATEWLWSLIRWGKIDYREVKDDASKYLPFPPSLWVTWLRGFQQVAVTVDEDDVKYWAGLAVTKMEETMRTHGFTAEKMEAWDPAKRSLRADIWEDEKYAHLFKVPEKA
ncbi:hypothetical protein J7T55_004613 [Diaporthe amygdali]|uniref:uncharacterized protein n=1 Tax=Phomopsis amygdali TaxID=1214568 RepID=UPI0022FE08E3|nr:uncharacterized protein J7T55_004613 [Diaporthe amygdali]KAJ0114871.1 hypothetical protein J7T55_004613 [Diaporthe amygdali]